MTEELKKALEAAVTDEQKKAVVEKFKEEIQKLSEDELDRVAGGLEQQHPNINILPSPRTPIAKKSIK